MPFFDTTFRRDTAQATVNMPMQQLAEVYFE